MRSFSDYIIYRSSLSIDEMAAPSQEYIDSKGKKVVKDEVRRTPIFMDQDDINYLYQFPPMFWKQALMKRYGELLQSAYEQQQKGQKVPDQQEITISLSGGGRATFSVNTEINELLDKLTHDVDNNKYRSLDAKDAGSYLAHAKDVKEKEGKNLGQYGFVLSGFSSGKGLRASKGFVSPDESTVRRALGQWYDSISNGWFDEEIPEDHRIESVKIGSAGRGSKINKKLKVFPEIKRWKSKQNKVYESYLPILRPAVMVKSSEFNNVEIARQAVRQIDIDLRTEGGVNQYFQILDINSPNLINMDKLNQVIARMTQIEKTLESTRKDTDDNSKLKKELANLEKLAICAEVIGGINLGVREKNVKSASMGSTNPTRQNMNLTPIGKKLRILIAQASKEKNPEQKITAIIKSFISRMRRLFESRAQRSLQNAERYSIHQWNVLHSKGKNPYTNWVGFGTINPNWQQKEVIHGPLQDNIGSEKIPNFWKHLLEDLDLKSSVLDGVDYKIKSVKGDPIKDAIRMALIGNREDIIDQASDYFMFIGSKGPILDYSDIYKKTSSGQELSSDENRRRSQVLENMKKFAATQGNNFTGSLAQLHVRFKHPEKWNRILRSANPAEIPTSNSAEYTMEEIFRNFYQLHSNTHPETSHAIDVLLARIAQNPESELEISIPTDRSSAKIPETEENKQLSKNIIAVVAGHMKSFMGKMGRMLGISKKSPPPPAETDKSQPNNQNVGIDPVAATSPVEDVPAKRGSFRLPSVVSNFMLRKKQSTN